MPCISEIELGNVYFLACLIFSVVMVHMIPYMHLNWDYLVITDVQVEFHISLISDWDLGSMGFLSPTLSRMGY